MQTVSRTGSGVNRSISRNKLARRARRQREYVLESLERRIVLSYTFTYNPVTHVATAQGDAAADCAGHLPDRRVTRAQRQRQRVR